MEHISYAAFLSSKGHNVTTEHVRTEGPFGSGRVAPPHPGAGDTTSRPIALKGISAQQNRGDRKLSSAALWNRHLHHRPVQRDLRGAWPRSAVGAPGKLHRRGI